VRDAAAFGVALQLPDTRMAACSSDSTGWQRNSGYVSAGTTSMAGLYVNNGTGLWPGFALRLGRPSRCAEDVIKTE
jgi:uncharacterized protein